MIDAMHTASMAQDPTKNARTPMPSRIAPMAMSVCMMSIVIA